MTQIDYYNLAKNILQHLDNFVKDNIDVLKGHDFICILREIHRYIEGRIFWRSMSI